jgi:peptidoglycan/LPS O-acetylase OafA/YrhL
MPYNPALDGLRAISVIAVVAFHCRFMLYGGAVGVDVFFVLSGYLITTILRSEIQRSGNIDLKRFYIRRAARLMPPLVLSMTATYAAYRYLVPDINIGPGVIVSLLYLSDYGAALWDTPHLLSHTWSLSVEEHFYMVWPVFLIMTRKLPAKVLFRALVAMFVVATLWRIIDLAVWHEWIFTYYRFDTRLSGLVLGSALAVRQWRMKEETARVASRNALYVLGILSLVLFWGWQAGLQYGTLIADIAAATLIVSLTSGQQTAVARLLSHRWAVYIGTLSYSIYLWHFGATLLLRASTDRASAFVLSCTFAVAVSAISYRYVEKPIKAWSHRYNDRESKAGVRELYAN